MTVINFAFSFPERIQTCELVKPWRSILGTFEASTGEYDVFGLVLENRLGEIGIYVTETQDDGRQFSELVYSEESPDKVEATELCRNLIFHGIDVHAIVYYTVREPTKTVH